MESMNFRIGQGYDVHRLTPGRRLVLGGVEIPFRLGLLGHSDADVLVHAIMDAALGAAGLGDIGLCFPDTDAQYLDISSLIMLGRVRELLEEKGYRVGNIDATIVAQAPKLSPFRLEMAENIAEVLDIPLSAVNVKATTEEGLGFTGTGEGMAAYAVCLLVAVPGESYK